MCTIIDCLKSNINCSQIACASSNRSAKAIISTDSREHATRRDFYDLYKSGIAIWLLSAKRNTRPCCDDMSAFLENTASVSVILLYLAVSKLGNTN